MCEDYRRLFDDYQRATAIHSHSVGDLSRASAGYRDIRAIWQECEKARLASEQARNALDIHIAEHGCVGQTLKAG